MRGSTMAELFFEDARVPVANRLGEEGSGVLHMMRNLELERLVLAAMSVGIGIFFSYNFYFYYYYFNK